MHDVIEAVEASIQLFKEILLTQTFHDTPHRRGILALHR
jgi:hypothetical protein